MTLRGLSLNGHYIAAYGIRIASAPVVHVNDCRVEHAQHHGILSLSSNTRLFVNDSVLRENRGRGLAMLGQSTRLTVDNSRFENNSGSGISAEDGVGSITRTVTASNLGSGILWGKGQLDVAWSTSTDNYSDEYTVYAFARIYLVFGSPRQPEQWLVHDWPRRNDLEFRGDRKQGRHL